MTCVENNEWICCLMDGLMEESMLNECPGQMHNYSALKDPHICKWSPIPSTILHSSSNRTRSPNSTPILSPSPSRGFESLDNNREDAHADPSHKLGVPS
jgi:hypothetical protein